MGRGAMLLTFVGCVLLASVCLVQADRAQTVRFEIYEHDSSSNELEVFGPRSSDRNVGLSMFSGDSRNNNKGRGVVYSNKATKNNHPNSERLAEVSGLYFYINNNQVEKISTIYFEDVEVNEDKRFSNAQLHLRGVWNKGRDQEKRSQELAIIGGTEGLARARGSVKYERLERGDTYKVVGEFQIEESESP